MVSGTVALRPPDPVTAARQAARVARGLAADGPRYPRENWRTLATTTTGLSCVVGVIALINHSWPLAVVALASIAVAAVVWRFIAADPLRLTSAQRRRIRADRTWRSRHDWKPPLTATPERQLLDDAQQAVRRIAASEWWAEPLCHRMVLDLAAELDEIDDHAYALASAGEASHSARAALAARVAALTEIAAEVGEHRLQAAPDCPDTVVLTNAVLDEFASQQLAAITKDIQQQ
ncbi:hypothetical protein FOS14_21200 [Skermania sp. ID1734]|uniref:hypothetical protein n=1 Tax=Skermania sp. ID1734 TaxID=2597516 RepID=UPI00118012EF|nr:hypothetical protein [Skermania sp. ID1734]TSD94273.1 hypothetical protein FOS14_21200 [Skermania sp. ID1734]